MFAVIKTGGKQYKAELGAVLEIEKLDAEQGKTVTFDEVLLIEDDGKTLIGEPFLKGALVEGEVLEQFKDKKVLVFKKKRRKQYKRTYGHRQQLTKVQIKKIQATGGKVVEPEKKAAPKAAPAAKAAPAVEAKAAAPKAKPAAESAPAPAKKPAAPAKKAPAKKAPARKAAPRTKVAAAVKDKQSASGAAASKTKTAKPKTAKPAAAKAKASAPKKSVSKAAKPKPKAKPSSGNK